MITLGLMSGTSMDGLDIAAVDFSNSQATLLAANTLPYPDDLRQDLLALAAPNWRGALAEYARLDHAIADFCATQVRAFLQQYRLETTQIAAIGSHGQTVGHYPDAPIHNTLQIGDPNLLAFATGIPVVADIRRRDMAAGGQGAPLVPAFHHAQLHSSAETRIVLNIGGISNISLLSPSAEQAIGFDTGPGNVFLDYWIQQQQGQNYDANGDWASSGQSHKQLLSTLLDDPYFARPAPKSTGREYFSEQWLTQKLAGHTLAAADVQATLVEFTASSIAQSILQTSNAVKTVIVCGGGGKNRYLLKRLQALLPTQTIKLSDELGINADYMEAMAFAWFAYRFLNQQTANMPRVTGAKQAVMLGGYYPA